MMLRRHRNDLWFVLCFMSLTLDWGTIGLPWAFAPLFVDFGGLGVSESGIKEIQTRFPTFLVDPATFENGNQYVLVDWIQAEGTLRLALVAGSWLLMVAVFWFVQRRYRRSLVLRIESWTPR